MAPAAGYLYSSATPTLAVNPFDDNQDCSSARTSVT